MSEWASKWIMPTGRSLAMARKIGSVIRWSPPADSGNPLRAAVADAVYFGDHLRLRCTLDGQAQATVKLPLAGGAPPVEGQPVWLQFPRAHLRVYA